MATVANLSGTPAYTINGVVYYTDTSLVGVQYEYTVDEIGILDNEAVNNSLAIRTQANGTLQAFISKYNGIYNYGQSLAVQGGAARLSTTEVTDNLCFGTRPVDTAFDNAVFEQAGAAAFAALTSAAGSESSIISTVNGLRERQLNFWSLAADSSHLLVANSAGTGGKAIEELSPGASPEIYGALLDLVGKSITAAGADTYSVSAICFLQGETNYAEEAFENTEAGYKTLLEALYADMLTDIMADTTQTKPFGLFTTQPCAWYDDVLSINAIGNAHIAASLDNPGIYLTTPYYAFPSASNHPTNDGYRYIGGQFAKVINKVLVRREGWMPCYAKSAVYRRNVVLLTIHTPEPPLQVKQCYGKNSTTLTDIEDYGFSFIDDTGRVPITSIELFDNIIKFTLERALSTSTIKVIQYASFDYMDGQGNICDSDPAVSQSISTLTSEPYELVNWLCSFRMNIVSDE